MPERHFTEREIAEGEAYHRPLRLVGLGGIIARFMLLIGSAAVAGRLATSLDAPATVTAGRVALGAVLTVVPLRLVAMATDTWFEYRHQHIRPDHEPVPAAWFAVVGFALTALALMAVGLAAWAGYLIADATERWPSGLSALVAAVVLAFVGLERPVRAALSWPKERTLSEPAEVAGRFAELARAFDLPGLSFLVRPGGDGGGPMPADPLAGGIRGLNAYATGIGPNRRIVMTDKLVDEPAPTRDFVVAHELTHLARHHVVIQTALSTSMIVVGIWVLAWLAADGTPWDLFGLDPLDPIGLPVVAAVGQLYLGATGPIAAWVARSQERSADVGAIRAVGVPDRRDAAHLHGGEFADLTPPFWLRLYTHHPTAYERMEFLARHRD